MIQLHVPGRDGVAQPVLIRPSSISCIFPRRTGDGSVLRLAGESESNSIHVEESTCDVLYLIHMANSPIFSPETTALGLEDGELATLEDDRLRGRL